LVSGSVPLETGERSEVFESRSSFIVQVLSEDTLSAIADLWAETRRVFEGQLSVSVFL
jgi:hypothetical protein